MSATFKTVINTILDFAKSHKQIKTADFGYFWFKIDTLKDREYPLIWISPVPSNLVNTQFNLKLQILVSDKLDPEQTNLTDVYSDTLQIAMDFVREYCATYSVNDQQFWFDEKTITINPFEPGKNDELYVAGWILNISIITELPLNPCSIPD